MAKTPKPKPQPVKKITIHAADGSTLPDRIHGNAYARDARVLCGIALWYTEDLNGYEVSRRRPTVQIDFARRPVKQWHGGRKDRKACSACRKLALMPPAERAVAILNRDADRLSKAAASKLERADKRQLANAELELAIEAARVDALVCLDRLERDGVYLRRCKRWIYPSTAGASGIVACALELGHDLPRCRGPRVGEQLPIDVFEVIAIAIQAQKHARNRPDRGDRVYVMRARYRCVHCEWLGYAPIKSPSGGHRCPTCADVEASVVTAPVATLDQPLNQKDLICRFCDHVVAHDLKLGTDYSGLASVRAHCIPCALKFLAGVQTTDQDDAPVLTSALPPSSFVLELDR